MNKFKMFSPLRDWKKEELPAAPFVSLAVGAHIETHGQVLLTPQLMVDSEIDYEIDGLIKELEEFRVMAKKELRTLQSTMLNK